MKKESIFKRAINRSFYYGFSSVLGRIVGFLMLPIYTNYLTPADYGVAGFLMFFVYLSQSLIGGRMEMAISKFYYDNSINYSLGEIVNTATAITTLLSVIPIALAMIYSAELSVLMFNTDEYSLAVMIVSLNILFITTETYGLRYLNIVDRPKTYLFLNIFKLLFQLTVNVWLIVFLEVGIIGVVISLASASILITCITFIIIFKEQPDVKVKIAMFKTFFKFSIPLWGASILGLYSGSIHHIFISKFVGLNELGLYSLGATFGGLVAALAWAPFFTFWSNERFKIYEQENAKEIYQKVFYISAGITLFLSFGIAIFSDPVIRIMANKDFHEASSVVAPLCLVHVLLNLGWFLNFSFNITDNNKQVAKNGVVYAMLVTIFYFILIPSLGYVGAAYGLFLANFIMLHIIEWKTRKFYNMGLNILKIDLMIVATFLLYFSFNYINQINDNPWISVVVLTLLNIILILTALLVLYLKNPVKFKVSISEIKLSLRNKSLQ